jgi:hypothetical protein
VKTTVLALPSLAARKRAPLGLTFIVLAIDQVIP